MPLRCTEERIYSSVILDLGNGWRWVLSFTSQPLHTSRRNHCTHWTGGWVFTQKVLHYCRILTRIQRINKLKPDSPVANFKKIGLAVLKTFQAKSDGRDDFTACHASQPTRLKSGYRWKMWSGFQPIYPSFRPVQYTMCLSFLEHGDWQNFLDK
jgi:hypothetical protein